MSYLKVQNATALTVKEPIFTPIAASTVTALTCNSSSEARPARIEGITTPKEFKALVDAISFAKTLDYPMTTELIQSLSGIEFTTKTPEQKRRVTLICSIIELSHLHDDIYTDNCRKVYRDDDGECIVYPDGSIDRTHDQQTIDLLKKIEIDKRNKSNNSKGIDYSVSIDYSAHKSYTFINSLLLSSFIEAINDGKMHRYGYSLKDDPLVMYRIDPYEMKVNSMGVDPKFEMYKSRLIKHLFGFGLDKNLVFDLRTFADDIGTLFGYVALKNLPQYKKNLRSSRSISKHGKHLFDLYVGSSNKSGYISSRASGIRFFSEQTLVEWHMDLFTRKKAFMKNWHYKVYEPSDLLNKIAKEVLDFVRTLKFHAPENKQIRETDNIFSFKFDDMMKMNIRDAMSIMSHSVGVTGGDEGGSEAVVWVNLDITDNLFSRTYSLFDSIKKESRLEVIEYDDGAGQQTIMMQIVNDPQGYPLHSRLIADKKAFRAEVMERIDCDYDTAKKRITALNNGGDLIYYGKKTQQMLKPYKKEAQQLAEVFMKTMEEKYPFIYQQALTLAKEAKDDDLSVGGKRFYGTLFHCYTHFERLIREAKKSCYTMPVYDVHDAVYSRETIEPDVLEKAVLDQTGFKVKIERSCP